MDAYEFSFVAVPAQRDAGVLKGMGRGRCLKELAEEFGVQKEYRQLWKQAQLGQLYESRLRSDAVRMCLALELGPEEPLLQRILEKAAAEDLLKFNEALTEKMREVFPMQTQLPGMDARQEEMESGFLI
jgi:hypothetical protein